jgi:hypothetical protein
VGAVSVGGVAAESGGGVEDCEESCVTLEIHPIANMLPRLGCAEFAILVEDIRNHGLREPIWLYQGRVLDGRHRLEACRLLGIEPETKAYDGIDPVGFVLSQNTVIGAVSPTKQSPLAGGLGSTTIVSASVPQPKPGQVARLNARLGAMLDHLRSPELIPASHPKSDASAFRKQLGWLIKESPAAVKMTITPGMAGVMMERNATDEWKNRPASENGVTRFARAMRSGRWAYTAETIVSSSSGRLLNGQHRLSACMQADVPIDVLVAFGVDDEAFKYMDIGVTRTAGHIFAIEGIPHYNYTAAVCRIVRCYLSSPTWSGNADLSGRIENDELLDFYNEHSDIPLSYPHSRKLNDEGLLPQRWGGALHYICAMKSRKAADAFFDSIASDLGHTDSKSPEYLLRKRLTSSARAPGDSKEAPLYLAAYTIQAWNARRKGDKRSIFRWRGAANPNEPFPRAI